MEQKKALEYDTSNCRRKQQHKNSVGNIINIMLIDRDSLLFWQKTSITPGSYYDCKLLPFFELGTVHYHFYLINIRIPVFNKMQQVNHDIGKIEDIQFIVRKLFYFILEVDSPLAN